MGKKLFLFILLSFIILLSCSKSPQKLKLSQNINISKEDLKNLPSNVKKDSKQLYYILFLNKSDWTAISVKDFNNENFNINIGRTCPVNETHQSCFNQGKYMYIGVTRCTDPSFSFKINLKRGNYNAYIKPTVYPNCNSAGEVVILDTD